MNRRGLTLPEALIGSAIALALGIVMVKMLSSGLSAQKKGTESRDAQVGLRNVMGTLSAELRSAAVPPLTDPRVITPVFWPGAWGATQEPAVSDPFYLREEIELDEEGSKRDLASNRLVYVRLSETDPGPAAGPLARFALVELLVPSERPSVIERRLHSLEMVGGLLSTQMVTGADGVSREAWVLDPALLASQPTPEQPVILYDAGPNARVAFRVGHRTFEPASDPGRSRYPQIFDPGVFKVDVAIGISRVSADTGAWPQLSEWSTLREETTEIRIPAVRQN